MIIAEDDKEDMDNVIRDNISDFITTRVITRSGVVTNIKNLKKVRAEEAKSIIIIIIMVVLFSIPIYKIGKKLLSYTTSKGSSSTIIQI